MGMLATDVDVPEAVLQQVIRTWLPLWGAAAKVLLRLWLDFEYVADSMPAGDAAGSVQAELHGEPVSGMPDGKDFKTERWNHNPLLRRLTCVYGCGRGGGDCAVAVVVVVAVVSADCCLYCRLLRCCCRCCCCCGTGVVAVVVVVAVVLADCCLYCRLLRCCCCYCCCCCGADVVICCWQV